jgi:TrmH family RNA methyltransferase
MSRILQRFFSTSTGANAAISRVSSSKPNETRTVSPALRARLLVLKSLAKDKRARLRDGLFVVHHEKHLDAAADAQIVVNDLFVDRGSVGLPQVTRMVQKLQLLNKDLVVWDVPARILDTSTDAGSVDEMVGIAARPQLSFDGVVETSGLWLLICDVNDPTNAGVLVRTAEATGCTGVVFCGVTCDPLGPKVVRSSAGSLFRIPVFQASFDDVKRKLTAHRFVALANRSDATSLSEVRH